MNKLLFVIFTLPGKSAGPLRQATAPPRSGAGVGVGILREKYGFLEIPKIRKLICQK